jgi:membrane associated rhomboid family serine protease
MRFDARRTPATAALFVAILVGALLQFVLGAFSDEARLAGLGANRSWAYMRTTGEYWRLLTSMFLHGGILHLAMNLFALYQLGRLYEMMFGSRRFTFIYFITGIAASLTSMMRMPLMGSSVGASGAIFGILGAFVFSIRRSPRYRNDRAARGLVTQCVFWILANIAIGLQVAQIDNAAHIGGLVAGLLLGLALPHDVPPPPPTFVIDVQPYEDGNPPRTE